VHLVRNSLRYASKKHWGQITRELREIYTAPTVAAAEVRFGEFAETWRATYPAMTSSWETTGPSSCRSSSSRSSCARSCIRPTRSRASTRSFVARSGTEGISPTSKPP